MNRAPAFQYYAKDHIATLASLTMEERGTWITLVNHCWENGGPISIEVATRLVGEKRLQSVRFLSLYEGDTITFEWIEEARAKMALRSQINAENGTLGGRGNRRRSKRKSERFTKSNRSESKTKPFRAEDEVENTVTSKGKERAENVPFVTPEAQHAWIEFVRMRTTKRRPMTDHARSLILRDLVDMGEPEAIKALLKSVRNGWTDVYKPNTIAAKVIEINGAIAAKAHTGKL